MVLKLLIERWNLDPEMIPIPRPVPRAPQLIDLFKQRIARYKAEQASIPHPPNDLERWCKYKIWISILECKLSELRQFFPTAEIQIAPAENLPSGDASPLSPSTPKPHTFAAANSPGSDATNNPSTQNSGQTAQTTPFQQNSEWPNSGQEWPATGQPRPNAGRDLPGAGRQWPDSGRPSTKTPPEDQADNARADANDPDGESQEDETQNINHEPNLNDEKKQAANDRAGEDDAESEDPSDDFDEDHSEDDFDEDDSEDDSDEDDSEDDSEEADFEAEMAGYTSDAERMAEATEDFQNLRKKRNRFDSLTPEDQAAIIALLDQHDSRTVARILALPPSRGGMNFKISKSGLNGFRRRYENQQAARRAAENARAAADLLDKSEDPDRAFKQAFHRLLRMRTLDIAGDPATPLTTLESIVGVITKLDKQNLAERKQAFAEKTKKPPSQSP